LGNPDHVSADVMHWLIVPGPPLACYLAYVTPSSDPSTQMFYHQHPNTWSLHVVLAGVGTHCVEKTVHRIGPGSVIYQGPGVPHSIYPDPGSELVHLVVQHPSTGYRSGEWAMVPEGGLAPQFGNTKGFLDRFGSAEQLLQILGSTSLFSSERWIEWARQQRAGARKTE
jgi:quercetin dioxygenase-like cupin family protein